MDWREVEAHYGTDVVGGPTIPRLFEGSVDRNDTRIAQQYKGGVYDRSLVADGVLPAAPAGEYANLTYEEMRSVVRTLATGFRELGVAAADRVGIFATTRMEWAQCDFALLAAGGVVTAVYASSSPDQVSFLLDDADASGVVVEDADALRRVLSVEDDLDLDFVVVVDEIPDGSGMAGAVRDRDDLYSLGDVHELGAAAYDAETYESWLDHRDATDLASLIYTSGTTGRPKGVEVTHRNFRANVDQTYRRFRPRPDDPDRLSISPSSTTLSFLPLAHVFERLSGHYLMFAAGATVAYAENSDTLREDFQLVRPTTSTGVPRVYEKLYDAIRAQASDSTVRERLFEWAVDVGRTFHTTDEPGAVLTLQHRLADRLVFSQVREAVGDRLDFFVSGGGSLSADLCALYHGMGLPILEGYGLTETSPVVSVNPPDAPKPGTIGPPVADVDVRIDESVGGDPDRSEATGAVGELLVRGPNVTDGYWKRPKETEQAFTADGWFRTGDIVHLRSDDYIEFRERAKQLLVLSTGKNVEPGPIEDAFASNSLVEQCLVLGDGQKFVSALLVPNVEAVREWADREGIDLPADRRELCRDERVHDRFQREVDRVNENFEAPERIKQFRVVPEEFTEENGLLTPTMKKKRRHILDQYADEVAILYENATSSK